MMVFCIQNTRLEIKRVEFDMQNCINEMQIIRFYMSNWMI